MPLEEILEPCSQYHTAIASLSYVEVEVRMIADLESIVLFTLGYKL
jgi:hypothetical protein